MASGRNGGLSALWTIRGSAAIHPELSNEAVTDRLEEMLRAQGKPVLRPQPEVLAFESSIFSMNGRFGSNWRAMALCDRGRFWIEQDLEGRKVRYDLRLQEAFLACLAFSGLAMMMQVMSGQPGAGVVTGLLFFGFLFGTNRLLAWIRIPGRIERCAQHLGTGDFR